MVSAESGQAVADGTEVTWFASHGRIRSTSTTVGGVATTVLDATKGRFGTCTVSAGVTNFLASTTIEFTNVGQTELVVEHPVLVADETEDGTTTLYEALELLLKQFLGNAEPARWVVEARDRWEVPATCSRTRKSLGSWRSRTAWPIWRWCKRPRDRAGSLRRVRPCGRSFTCRSKR